MSITYDDKEFVENRLPAFLSEIKDCVKQSRLNYMNLGKCLSSLFNDYEHFVKKFKLMQVVCSSFGFEKSQVYNYINVYDRFHDKEEFEGYSFSKLVEFLPLTDECLLSNFHPEMTIKQIREKKKQLFQTSGKDRSYYSYTGELFTNDVFFRKYDEFFRSLGVNVEKNKFYKITVKEID